MSLKKTLLGQLKPAVIKQLKDEIAEGKLDPSKEYDFEVNFERIYDNLMSDALLGTMLKTFKIFKKDLKPLIKDCLLEVGVQL